MRNEFIKIINRLETPELIEIMDLYNFLLDFKETTKTLTLLGNMSDEYILSMNKEQLIVLFDYVRDLFHSSKELLESIFPSLNKEFLDKVSNTYQNVDYKKIMDSILGKDFKNLPKSEIRERVVNNISSWDNISLKNKEKLIKNIVEVLLKIG